MNYYIEGTGVKNSNVYYGLVTIFGEEEVTKTQKFDFGERGLFESQLLAELSEIKIRKYYGEEKNTGGILLYDFKIEKDVIQKVAEKAKLKAGLKDYKKRFAGV